MAKVSRTVLKSLVKECLVEILSEGLVGSNRKIQESKKSSAKRPTRPTIKKKKITVETEIVNILNNELGEIR